MATDCASQGHHRAALNTGSVCMACGRLPGDFDTAQLIAEEVRLARAKFPGNRLLLAALMEEVGELARAYLQKQGSEQVQREAIQVAAIAVRIIEEGDATFNDITTEESQP